jgi:lysozyme
MAKRTLVAAAASAAALAAIVGWESYRGTAYDDGGGVQTIGFGTTKGVKTGDHITPVRAVQRLAADANATAQQIGACIGPVPLYQYEWDAYTSLAYNIGPTAFCGSTLVQRLHRQPPDYLGACKQILRWNQDNGRVVLGLVRRREAEFKQCIGDTP